MARLIAVQLPPNGSGPQPLHGASAVNEISVGMNGHNKRRSDVQLIQFFLRQFYIKHPQLFKALPPIKNPDGFVKIDGDAGGQTKTGVKVFQNYERSKGFLIATDGLVDVPRGAVSSISGTVYTILALNAWFNFFGEGKEHSGHLENHPDIISFAPELRTELMASNVTIL